MTNSTTEWVNHTLRHREWRPTRTAVALGILGLFVAIIIGALYLSQSANSSAMGRQLEVLIAERNDLEQTNERLRAEIASLRGVGRLLTRATELGFISATQDQIMYVVVNGYNPGRDEMPELADANIPQAQDIVVPAYDESFIGWAQAQFDALRQQLESFTQEGS